MDWPLQGLRLRVKDLEAELGFYRDLLGLKILEQGGLLVRLAPPNEGFILELLPDPAAPLRPQPSLGLYHFALLLPDRKSLAAVLRRLVEARYPYWDGASDHGVSEALYLRDPEGNGLELYRDRPRAEWPQGRDKVAMYSRRLDLDGLLAESPAPASLHPDTLLGHLHLHVADLDQAERFFTQATGMEVTQRDYPGARFLAVDGYHHHLGINTWAGGRTAPAGATGLLSYWWKGGWSREELEGRLRGLGLEFAASSQGWVLTDPNGQTLHLLAEP
ncbi:MAG: glyoxalase [Meiothermus sp.]